MAYTNSSLVTYTKISPNRTSPRNHVIDTITIHCYVGQVTAERGCNGSRFVNYSANNGASCNYVVGYDGSIGLCVPESDRSWCSSNKANDHRAVTIEVASEKVHPYKVTDAAMKALINLVTDICSRNNIEKLKWSTNKTDRVGHKNGCNMTVHRDFKNKACPGEYLYNKHEYIAEEVNKRLTTIPVVPPTSIDDPNVEFFKKMAVYANEYATQYGISIVSPMLAQAGLESAYGTSELAVNANNFHGLKFKPGRCPGAFAEPYIKVGSEQNPDGSYVSSTMQWMQFSNMKDAVKGYFDFINISRYENLKGVTDPYTYLERIKADGYATSLGYVDNVYRVLEEYNLTQYDEVKRSLKYTIVKGDTLSKIAKKYGTTVSAIQKANPDTIKNINKISVGTVINIPTAHRTYIIAKGDTLSKIGKSFNVDWKDIAKVNNIKSPYILKVGREIIIP